MVNEPMKNTKVKINKIDSETKKTINLAGFCARKRNIVRYNKKYVGEQLESRHIERAREKRNYKRQDLPPPLCIPCFKIRDC